MLRKFVAYCYLHKRHYVCVSGAVLVLEADSLESAERYFYDLVFDSDISDDDIKILSLAQYPVFVEELSSSLELDLLSKTPFFNSHISFKPCSIQYLTFS